MKYYLGEMFVNIGEKYATEPDTPETKAKIAEEVQALMELCQEKAIIQYEVISEPNEYLGWFVDVEMFIEIPDDMAVEAVLGIPIEAMPAGKPNWSEFADLSSVFLHY